jgi:hypothetical protein
MLKKFLYILLLSSTFYFLSPVTLAHAKNRSFLTITYPIRGSEFWPLEIESQDPFSNFQFYLDQQQNLELPATFLFRYDALLDSRITTTARNFPDHLEAGLFLEITPQLAESSGVNYHQSHNWADATSVFISGYSPEERVQLIDTAISQFQKTLGTTPTSVGAWHIDAASASYLQQTYGVTTLLICADQFATDNYQLWGGWWGVPYYPSTHHILQPAQSQKLKLDLVVTHWATRDPLNGYGPTASEASLYSVQPNDYTKFDLDTSYFLKLLEIYTKKNSNQFGYLNIGLENDYSTRDHGLEFINQLQTVKDKVTTGQLQVLTLSQFSSWYRQTFPHLSPPHTISGPDPLGTNRTASWQMTPNYRLGIVQENGQTLLRDFRLYNQQSPEPHLSSPNLAQQLHLSVPAHTDTVLNPEKLQPISEEQLSQLTNLPTPQLPFSTNTKLVFTFYFLLFALTLFLLRKNKALTLILTLGSLTLSLPMIKSGLLYEYGMGYWGPHGHDAIWHLSLIEHFSRNINLNHPLLAGEILTNYHFLFDLLVALIHRITSIPNHTLYFQILPPLLALALGFSIYKFVYTWAKISFPLKTRHSERSEKSPTKSSTKLISNSKTAALLSLLFLYFGGSAGWIVNLVKGQPIFSNAESLFWSSQSISLLINPPLVLSLILLFVGLNLLIEVPNRRPPHTLYIILNTLIFGFLIQAKAYAVIITLPALFVYSILTTPKTKEPRGLDTIKNSNKDPSPEVNGSKIGQIVTTYLHHPPTKVFFGASLITTLLFLLFSRSASGLLEFSPLWFPHTMLAFADRLHWPQLENARLAYLATSNFPKLIAAELLALVLFLLGNLWLRSLGFIYIIKKIIKPKNLLSTDYLLLTTTFLSLLFTLLFVQRGNPWNTIQFFYYTQIFMGIFTAVLLSQWLTRVKKPRGLDTSKKSNIPSPEVNRNPKPPLLLAALLIILLNLPTTIGTLTQYLPHRAPSRIPYAELQALEFLKDQPEGLTLTQPFLEDSRNLYPPPKPLYAYETTAYVSAFSSQPTFVADYMNLEITGFDWQTKHDQALRYFRAPHTGWAEEFLKENQIKYLYIIRHHPLLGDFTPPSYLEKIFTTDEVTIYKFTSNPNST